MSKLISYERLAREKFAWKELQLYKQSHVTVVRSDLKTFALKVHHCGTARRRMTEKNYPVLTAGFLQRKIASTTILLSLVVEVLLCRL